MSNIKAKVAVLAGGVSSERDISIQSGKCVSDALGSGGYETVVADITPGDLRILEDKSIDVFFVCLHGQFGEDGQLQKILEDKKLCYTHSDSAASRLAMDKLAAKKRFACAGVRTPEAIEFDEHTAKAQIEKLLDGTADKLVVKPITQGSSVGVRIVSDLEEALETARKCREEFGDCMIEQFIRGREITAGILSGKALPIIEIRPKVGFYDYQAKYLDDNTEYLFGTLDDENLIKCINTDALKCFDSLCCRGVARVDFILGNDGAAYSLELNTVPGMTTHSCVPKAAARIGVSMVELCGRIVDEALADYQRMKKASVREIAGSGKTEKNKIVTKAF